jgi:hypothetical protein
MNPTNKPNLDEAFRRYADESRFAPHFAERLQARLYRLSEGRVRPGEVFAAELTLLFRRLVLVGVLVITLLGAYNLSSSEEWSVPAAFGVSQSAEIHESSVEMIFFDE